MRITVFHDEGQNRVPSRRAERCEATNFRDHVAISGVLGHYFFESRRIRLEPIVLDVLYAHLDVPTMASQEKVFGSFYENEAQTSQVADFREGVLLIYDYVQKHWYRSYSDREVTYCRRNVSEQHSPGEYPIVDRWPHPEGYKKSSTHVDRVSRILLGDVVLYFVVRLNGSFFRRHYLVSNELCLKKGPPDRTRD